MSKSLMVYFVAYFIMNYVAIVFGSIILNDITCNKIRLFFFTILLTIIQYFLHNYVAVKYNLNILYVIFSFPIIYMIVLYVLAKITKLIEIKGMGESIKLALLLVFFQICTKYAFIWKLAAIFDIDAKVF